MKLSTVPHSFGVDDLQAFLEEKIPGGIEKFEDVFGTDDIVTPQMVTEACGTKGITGLKTIDVITNPFNKVFIQYLASFYQRLPAVSEVTDMITPADFQEYVISKYGSGASTRKKINHSDIRPTVDYLVKTESYAEDLKKIPELANVNTNLVFSGKDVLYNNMYRDYYNDETKELVRTTFASDLEKYSYTF